MGGEQPRHLRGVESPSEPDACVGPVRRMPGWRAKRGHGHAGLTHPTPVREPTRNPDPEAETSFDAPDCVSGCSPKPAEPVGDQRGQDPVNRVTLCARWSLPTQIKTETPSRRLRSGITDGSMRAGIPAKVKRKPTLCTPTRGAGCRGAIVNTPATLLSVRRASRVSSAATGRMCRVAIMGITAAGGPCSLFGWVLMR